MPSTRAWLSAFALASTWGCTRPAPPTTPPAAEPAPVAKTAVLPEPEPVQEEPIAEPEPEPTPASGDALTPLTQEQQAILFGTREDADPEKRGGVTAERVDKHYVAGNEKALHAFFTAVRDRGGGYVGVGSDQAYLFIGWMRPEIAWLVDYDRNVVDVHEIYRLLLAASDTPEAMLLRWEPEARAEVEALIRAEHEGRRAKRLEALYVRNRGWIRRRLQAQSERLREAAIPSWLTDQATYDYVRAMLQARRVRPMLVNLLEPDGMNGVAEAARSLAVPIRVLYLSNAEEYWPKYTRTYRETMAALPTTDDAVVLRTLLIWDVNGDYRYNTQTVENYRQWLERPFVRNVYDVVHARPKPEREGLNFFETAGDPDQSPAARRAQKRAAEQARSQ